MWNEWFDLAVILTHVYRTHDKDYVMFTQQIGDGCISEENLAKLHACKGKPAHPDENIYAWTNREVKEENGKYLESIPGAEIIIDATSQVHAGVEDFCGSENMEIAYAQIRRRLHSDDLVPRFVSKCGADVILTANIAPEIGLYNGLRGVIRSFLAPGGLIPEGAIVLDRSPDNQNGLVWDSLRAFTPVVEWENGILHIVQDFTFSQAVRSTTGRKSKCTVEYNIVPLTIGKCSTLNKCIGREDEHVRLVLTSSNMPTNLAYIGLTRMKNGWGSLGLTENFDLRSIKMDPKCRELMQGMEKIMDELHVISLRGETTLDQYATRFEAVARQAARLGTPSVPAPMVDDEHNPELQIMSTSVTLRLDRKMQQFAHVLCTAGYVNPTPKSRTFYDMSSIPQHWFRDIVRYAMSSTNKNKAATQFIQVWDHNAHVTRRNCAGVLMCEHFNNTEDPCIWATSRISGQGKEASVSKLCPVHGGVQSSRKCGAVFLMYAEAEPWKDPANQRHGFLMTDHDHPAWSRSVTLHANSKQLIHDAVARNSNITYRQLVSGVSLQSRPATEGCLVRDDPALSNSTLVSKHLRLARKELGATAIATGLVAEVENALVELPDDMYIKSPLRLLRGPMPMVLCATDEQLFYACSSEHFTSQSIDFTFAEVLKPVDCMDNHSTDFDVGMTLTLWRIYAIKKSAEATEFYLLQFLKECHRCGLEFVFGVSIVSLIIDFHYGQALGVLRCLITVLGQVYLTFRGGLGGHVPMVAAVCIIKGGSQGSLVGSQVGLW